MIEDIEGATIAVTFEGAKAIPVPQEPPTTTDGTQAR